MEVSNGEPYLNGTYGTDNDSSMESSWFFPIPEPTPKLEIAIVMTIISIVGLIGNASIIFITLRHTEMRTTTDLLVTNLAVGDFAFFILHPPLHLHYFYTLRFTLGAALCKISVFAQYVSEGVSVFTLTALSIERYQAIARPMQLHTSGNPYRTIIITVTTWILSLAVASPTLQLADAIETWFPENPVCQPLPHHGKKAKVFKMCNFLITFAVPLIIITLFYCLTALQLIQSVRRAPKSGEVNTQGGEALRKSRMKLALVVLSLVIAFVICWSPYYVYELWFEFGLNKDLFSSPAMVMLSWWRFPILYASSCINPIILYTTSSKYRDYFSLHFCCCLRLLKKPQEPLSEGSGTYNATTKV